MWTRISVCAELRNFACFSICHGFNEAHVIANCTNVDMHISHSTGPFWASVQNPLQNSVLGFYSTPAHTHTQTAKPQTKTQHTVIIRTGQDRMLDNMVMCVLCTVLAKG